MCGARAHATNRLQQLHDMKGEGASILPVGCGDIGWRGAQAPRWEGGSATRGAARIAPSAERGLSLSISLRLIRRPYLRLLSGYHRSRAIIRPQDG